jgi:hypothetical protein
MGTRRGVAIERVQQAAKATAQSVSSGSSKLRHRLVVGLPDRYAKLTAQLPESARLQLREALGRLARVRSVDDASAFVTAEVTQLLTVIVPVFARYPLPLGRRSGRTVVALAAGGAAMTEELEAVAAIVSMGAAAPGASAVLAVDFTALVVEVYVAASVRVNQLRRAGLEVVPEDVARDLANVMTGATDTSGREATTDLAGRIAKRVLRRWAVGAAPIAGIAYDGWDAQRTVAAMSRLPLPSGPRIDGHGA